MNAIFKGISVSLLVICSMLILMGSSVESKGSSRFINSSMYPKPPFAVIDADNSGGVSFGEYLAYWDNSDWFFAFDFNSDGVLDVVEYDLLPDPEIIFM